MNLCVPDVLQEFVVKNEHHGQAGGSVCALFGKTRDLHRARYIRHDIRGGRLGQWNSGFDIRQAPKHAKRSQHLHAELSARRLAGDTHVCTIHVNCVHRRVLAVR